MFFFQFIYLLFHFDNLWTADVYGLICWNGSREYMKNALFNESLSHFLGDYCKSLIFSVPLYLANLANLTFSLIFKDAKLKRRQQYFFYTKISTLPSRLNKCR